jgi:hypothetical protein
MLLSSEGDILLESAGCLFPISDGADSLESLMHYKSVNTTWSNCPQGYSVYFRKLDDKRLVIYSLKIIGLSTRKGKTDKLNVWLTTKQFEGYISNKLRAFSDINDGFQKIIVSNLHEVKKLSGFLASEASMLKMDTEENLNQVEQTRITRLLAIQQLMAKRLEYFDFIFNPAVKDLERNKRIRVYDKFYKSVQIFKEKGIKVSIGGVSQKEIKGSPIFDILPFILIENAHKYSPDSGKVDVVVNDSGNIINIKLSSYGPLIENYEEKKIFENGYRGKSAAALITGSGIGLYVAKQITDIHRGVISVSQDKKDTQKKGLNDLYKTTFHLSFTATSY